MLGLVLLYWIGKYHYRLAGEFNKNEWGFAILGIIAYYIGTFFFGLVLGAVVEFNSPGYWDDSNEMLFGLMMLPFGILSTYLWYKYLERSWKKSTSDISVPSGDVNAQLPKMNREK